MSQERGPREAFKSFLDRAEDDGWLSSYKWHSADTFGLLRMKLNGSVREGWTRTHKKSTDGTWWALEIQAHDGTSIGVDLEILIERPILDNPQWITNRLNMPRHSQPRQILEEWSCRESAFKALAPDNSKILLGQFRRSAANTLTVLSQSSDRSVQTRASWAGRWVLSLAWRSL